jgi:hypothetical protein
MKVVVAVVGVAGFVALLGMAIATAVPAGAQGGPPKGCVRCEDLCVRCAEKLREQTGGKSHICRGTCRDWAQARGVKQIWVRPDLSLCAVKGGSFSSARCN